MALSRESAEVFALHALGWIVGQEEDVLPAFLGATGSSEADIRERVGDPEFQLCVLDFLMMDDQWIISCCDALQVPYERVAEARQAMPGGAEVSWT
ncbi:DUF3572 domain-containing protein [Planktotalea sp.]|jgi:hypothetical protein|uniref:DUF3572 domain-containing protein n=1 Tax=Planktotalea sp. TaxID=2029877 RepID=UPI0025F76DDB|nr:DUF3572 domain-containing protein [Planktotalea sp.]